MSKVAGKGPERLETDETPLGIARNRLAKGEITGEEFDELSRALG